MSRFRGVGRLAHVSVSIGWPPANPSLRGLGLPGASGALPEAPGPMTNQTKNLKELTKQVREGSYKYGVGTPEGGLAGFCGVRF